MANDQHERTRSSPVRSRPEAIALSGARFEGLPGAGDHAGRRRDGRGLRRRGPAATPSLTRTKIRTSTATTTPRIWPIPATTPPTAGTTPVYYSARGAVPGSAGAATVINNSGRPSLGSTLRALIRGESVCPGQVTVTPKTVPPACTGSAVATVKNGVTVVFNGCQLSGGGKLDGTFDVQANEDRLGGGVRLRHDDHPQLHHDGDQPGRTPARRARASRSRARPTPAPPATRSARTRRRPASTPPVRLSSSTPRGR